MSARIGIDKQMADVLVSLLGAFDTVRQALDIMANNGNVHAGAIEFDIVCRYEGEDSFVIGEWAGDWAELIDGDDLKDRVEQRKNADR